MSHNEIAHHTCQNDNYLKRQETTHVGKDAEKREPSYTTGGNVNWCSYYGEQYASSFCSFCTFVSYPRNHCQIQCNEDFPLVFERLLLNHANTPGFLAPGGEKFNPGPETRLDRSELLCNKVLLKYKGDRESF